MAIKTGGLTPRREIAERQAPNFIQLLTYAQLMERYCDTICISYILIKPNQLFSDIFRYLIDRNNF